MNMASTGMTMWSGAGGRDQEDAAEVRRGGRRGPLVQCLPKLREGHAAVGHVAGVGADQGELADARVVVGVVPARGRREVRPRLVEGAGGDTVRVFHLGAEL